MKKVMMASNIGSTFTYKENNMGQAVYSTLDKGQYAINAKSITLKNRVTGEVVKLGKSTPLFSKELFEFQMLIPREKLEKTLPGIIGNFFMNRHAEKPDWIITYKEA